MNMDRYSGPRAILLLLLSLCAAAPALAAESRLPPPGECPQPRFTGKAPDDYLARTNPLTADAENIAAGANLYAGKSNSIPCLLCHGAKGDGKGPLATQYNPPPRNFACRETVSGIPDGHLFWIVRYGSPGTAMPPARDLTDQQVWQLVIYLRALAQQ